MSCFLGIRWKSKAAQAGRSLALGFGMISKYQKVALGSQMVIITWSALKSLYVQDDILGPALRSGIAI